ISLLDAQRAGAERDARELTIQLALGGSLTAARGFAHAETGATYERAATLANAAGYPAQFGMARTGLAIFYFARGEVERGRALAAEVLAAAEARRDQEQVLIGHMNVAGPEFYQGKFASSLAHFERAIALYDPMKHHGHVRVFGNDQGISALNYSAWTLWQLGKPGAALARASEAVALASRFDHPFNMAFALVFETVVHYFRRDAVAQRERAVEVISLSEVQGFPFWLGLGRLLHAAGGGTQGERGAFPGVFGGLALAAEPGSQAGAPLLFPILAQAQHATDQLAVAQETVATGLAVAAETGQPFLHADLHRLEGDLVGG